MAKTELQKFEARLGLPAYFMNLFGVENPSEKDSVRNFYKEMNRLNEGYKDELSYVCDQLMNRATCKISDEKLYEYDQNIREYVEKINEGRTRSITLKYFQMLGVLASEIYLDRLSNDREKFRGEINQFLKHENESRSHYYQFEEFEKGDLNKLAYWMATGSGKTFIMHINYFQWLEHRPYEIENILLITPNSGLTKQHMDDMEESGIPCSYYQKNQVKDSKRVRVLEITKLADDPEEVSDEGEKILVDSFESRNLIFVDEGHKGATGDAWMSYRRKLTSEGFTFEYSATFGQVLGGADKDLQLEYGQQIALNYSYPFFHEDGYGKDYHILNLENVDEEIEDHSEQQDRYLLGNLLTFLEQKLCWNKNREIFQGEFNIEQPLLLFIGNSVTAGKTRSNLTKNEKVNLTDVQELIEFLNRVLRNENNWVFDQFRRILEGNTGIERDDSSDLFENEFPFLKESNLTPEELYNSLLNQVFNATNSSAIHLIDIEETKGEIGLRAGASQDDQFFGVIDIGDKELFIDLAKEEISDIQIGEDEITKSLFEKVNKNDSPIQMLLGSRKFIEGWNSWRVSCMGLMNFGRSQGPMIIQLFGRGVRLRGKDFKLKRSREIEAASPQFIELLETLFIFGIRAGYMKQFKEALEGEGIDTDEWLRLEKDVDVRPQEEYFDDGLIAPRLPEESVNGFEDSETISINTETIDEKFAPSISLVAGTASLRSQGEDVAGDRGLEEYRNTIDEEYFELIDWDFVYDQLWKEKETNGWDNLRLTENGLKKIITDEIYELFCADELIRIEKFEELKKVERLVVTILKQYLKNHYTGKEKEWKDTKRKYQELDENDPNILEKCDVRAKYVNENSQELKELEKIIEENPDSLFEEDDGLPPRVHFDRHLYSPLLIDQVNGDSGQLGLKFSPPGLNEGEEKFVRDLKKLFDIYDPASLLNGSDLYLLRNQSKGAGISFAVQKHNGDYQPVYPDFIMWLKSEDKQKLIFLEPHGLQHTHHVQSAPKIQLHKEIKNIQEELNDKEGRDDISLNSYLISTTLYDSINNPLPKDDLKEHGIYFPEKEPPKEEDNPEHLKSILEEVLREN